MEIAQKASNKVKNKARRKNMKRARQRTFAPRKTKAKPMQPAKHRESSRLYGQPHKMLGHKREDVYVKRKSRLFARSLGEACSSMQAGYKRRKQRVYTNSTESRI